MPGGMHSVLDWRNWTMKGSVLMATAISAVVLVPMAIWLDDILALSLAGLIPLYVDWKNRDLNSGYASRPP